MPYMLTLVFVLGNFQPMPTVTLTHEYRSRSACNEAGTEIIRQAAESGHQVRKLVFACTAKGRANWDPSK